MTKDATKNAAKNSGFQSTTNYMDEFNTEGDEDLDSKSSDGEAEDFGSMLADSLKSDSKKLKVGDKIRGKILNIGAEDVYVTTGTRKDGVLHRRELLDAEGNLIYKVGDVTDVFVTLVKGDDIRLSRNATDRNMAEDLKTAYDQNLPIQGRIVEVVKGGVRVNIKGKLAFCPISQIDSKHIESAEEYVGKSFDFKITEITEGGKNVVVSRRKLLDAEREIGQTSFLSEKKDGDVVTGRVTRFEPFGAFVELAPGVDGLIHISEIAWSRISSPEEVLQLGQEVTVKLLKREVLNGRAKISLSLKQVTPREVVDAQPSVTEQDAKKADAFSKFFIGQVFTGKVTRKEPYGIFVQIEPGVSGLMHKSRTENQNTFHFEKTRVNDMITVQIVEIKAGERQIALGLPGDSSEDDWKSTYKTEPAKSMGTLADRMNAALAKKK
jgi:small subunit ribosomal protein S1